MVLWLGAMAGSGCAQLQDFFHGDSSAMHTGKLPQDPVDGVKSNNVQTATGTTKDGLRNTANLREGQENGSSGLSSFQVLEHTRPPAIPVNHESTALSQPPPVITSQVIASATQRKDDDPVVLALTQLLNEHPTEALEYLKGYNGTTGGLMMQLLTAIAFMHDKPNMTSQEQTELRKQLESMLSAIELPERMSFEKLGLCSRVGGFQDFQELPATHLFQCGDRVQVYIEIKNNHCKIVDNKTVVAFKIRASILDGAGKEQWVYNYPLWQALLQGFEPMRGCHCVTFFSVPEQVPPGRYTLKIQVEDIAASPPEMVERTVDIHIGRSSP